MSQQTAVLQEVLDQAHLYKQNASLKNGLPSMPVRNVVTDEPRVVEKIVEKPVEKVVEKPVEKIVDRVVTQTVEKERSWLKDSLVGAAIGTLGLGGGVGLAALLMGRGEPSKVEQPPAVVAPNESKNYGDLLKYLRDNGYNLPPGDAQ